MIPAAAGHRHRCRCHEGALGRRPDPCRHRDRARSRIPGAEPRLARYRDERPSGLGISDRNTTATGQFPAPQPDSAGRRSGPWWSRPHSKRLADHRTPRRRGQARCSQYPEPSTIHWREAARADRDGAKLVETGDHILEEIARRCGAPDSAHATRWFPAAGAAFLTMDPAAPVTAGCLGFDPATTDQLVARTGFPAAEVSSMLLLLEMQGHVSSEPGGLFTRV